MHPRPRPTLNDVAERAGVSYQTVSRVINHHPYVATATRERVLRAIADLGFRPNRAAQSLAGSHSRTLGMVAFGMNQYGPAQMIIHIEQAARRARYDLIFANVNDMTTESMRAAINQLLHWEIDGLLCVTPAEGITHRALAELCGDTPFVQIGTYPDVHTPSVIIDQRQGAHMAVEHLVALGHRRLAEIRGPATWIDAETRHAAVVSTLEGTGAGLVASLEGDWTAETGYHVTQRLLQEAWPFTAIIIANDQMALGAMRALQERGIRIPEDVSIIGFDDIPEAAFFNPPLTTVRQDFDQLGQLGIAFLLELIQNESTAPEQRCIPPQLIERASTAAPPAA
jgi:LacI family transcriptional regulator